jgi:hypothetical protein
VSAKIFLSTVSDEFRAYRDQLRSDLTRHNVEVKVQEDFKMSIGDSERVCAMLNLLLRAYETTDHAERLEALEARLEHAGINERDYGPGPAHGDSLRA